MVTDSMHYDSTAEDLAKHYGLTTKTIIGWAREGYPVTVNGETTRVKVIGAQQVGKQWRFNFKAFINFVENLGDERWVRLNVNTKTRPEKLSPLRTGRASSTLTANASAQRLKEHLHSRKSKQISYATT